MRIELLRHGECADNAWLRGRTDSPLNPQGWAQMQTAWPKSEPSRLISSPLVRCAGFVQTQLQTRPVEFSSNAFSESVFDESWQERDFGLFDGLPYGSVQTQFPGLLQAYLQDPFHTDIPGAEPYAAFKQRVLAAWQHTLQQALADKVEYLLIVTHGGPMRLVLQSVLGIEDRQLFQLQIGYGCRVGIEVTATPEGPFCQLREIIQADSWQEKTE
ncbi:histidine phosphatase family protein [Thiomicrorhabdus cannonii]|uniref:histidine phosphatase family protein n=1 Tax=Thiomicrorhabdus cannonii TaxID=2748011 RepID=UPI0015BAD79D